MSNQQPSLASEIEGSLLKKIIFVIVGLFFLFWMMVGGGVYCLQTFLFSSAPLEGDFVGLVDVEGVIFDSRKILKRLEELEEENQVKAIVLRLNSPGGAVAPSQEIYEAIKHCSKPVVASMASVAASGAFYIAMGAQKVFANPGTLTGSIGVIMEFANLQKLYEWAKIKRYSVKTGKFKDAGSEYREMTFEEKQLFQMMADDILEQFQAVVVEGRKLSKDQVSKIADGRVFSGRQALAQGLIDELGTFQDAVAWAGRLGKISGKPRVLEMKKKKALLQYLLDEGEDSFQDDSLGSTWRNFKHFLQLLSFSGSSQWQGAPSRADLGPFFLFPGVRF